MKFNYYTMYMVLILFSIFLTKNASVKTDDVEVDVTSFFDNGFNIYTGDITIKDVISVDTTTCNTDITHNCKNTTNCNISVGPCKAQQETISKTTK